MARRRVALSDDSHVLATWPNAAAWTSARGVCPSVDQNVFPPHRGGTVISDTELGTVYTFLPSFLSFSLHPINSQSLIHLSHISLTHPAPLPATRAGQPPTTNSPHPSNPLFKLPTSLSSPSKCLPSPSRHCPSPSEANPALYLSPFSSL